MKPEATPPEERVHRMRATGRWPDLTVVGCLDKAVREHPDAVAIVDHNSSIGKRTCLTYRELDARVMSISVGLWKRGVRAGDVVSVQLPNWWEFVATHLACVRIGAITNPLMPFFRERELSFMLGLARTRVLIVPHTFRGFDYEPLAQSLITQVASLEHVFAAGTAESTFEQGLLQEPDSADIAAIADLKQSPNSVVQILYTSGTTGEPKGVMHTSNTLFSNIIPYARRLGLHQSDVALMASPLAHQTGFMYGMMLPIYLGCKAVLQDVWRAKEAGEIVHREAVTYTMGSTPFLSDLSDHAAKQPDAFNTLRLFHSAGATIPRQLVRDATERLGATIISGWGMTENGAAATTKPTDPAEKIFETDGCPMDGMELRVVDGADHALPPGEVGALQVKGCSNFVGYLRRPELYATDEEGWFSTGDLARLDRDGYLRITGRIKDVVIRGGENIPVVEIEGLLFKHPQVREVAIVGRTDVRLGERCAAWVVPRTVQPPSLEDITRFLADEGVSKTYFPEFLRVVDELPKTPSGKVQKFALRAQEAKLSD